VVVFVCERVLPGSPGGFPPRAPTDPDVRIFRIRFFESWIRSGSGPISRLELPPVSLSSHSGKEFARSLPLPPLSRLAPRPGSPLPSAGSLGSVPPLHRSYRGATTPLRPSRALRSSLVLRYRSCARCSLLSAASAPPQAWGFGSGSPTRFFERRRGVSQVPGEPLCERPVLRPRSGLRISPCRCVGAVAAKLEDVDPSELNCFEAQSHGSHTRCLRFAAALLSDSRKTRFRLLARLCRAGFFRLPGSDERFP
jgi:hypothetical protein